MGTPNALTPGKRLKLTREDGQGANGNGGELEGELVAIKKFKPDKEGEVVQYTGISQSACREIMVRPSDSACSDYDDVGAEDRDGHTDQSRTVA